MAKKIHYASYERPTEGHNHGYWSDTTCGISADVEFEATEFEPDVTCKNCLRRLKENYVINKKRFTGLKTTNPHGRL